ncbi:MAG: hypothetical protein QM784_33155 [Polyangiaceae bacterium]
MFPVGTVFYKTFLSEGVRLETRVLRKTHTGRGIEAWDVRAYAWNREQTEATDVTDETACTDCAERRRNVLGTNHDIPSRSDCLQCHRAAADGVNGFGALQLNHPKAGYGLEQLVAAERLRAKEGLLSTATLPGTPVERDAIGYLHGNCSHCHRRASDDGDGTCATPACLSGLRTFAKVGLSAVEQTELYQTAVERRALYPGFGADVNCRVASGHSDVSILLLRMLDRGTAAQMPRIATKVVDDHGVEAVERWIDSLPSKPTRCEF